MAYHDVLLHSDAEAGAIEGHTPLNVLIRRGLRQAFPLPALGQAADEKFRQAEFLNGSLARAGRTFTSAATAP